MTKLNLSKQKNPFDSNKLPLASIIITNYNYEKFLPRAIDSALRQTYPVKEIIVVDDGSTDSSRQIINSYGNKIIPVFKENGGKAAATNTGFFASHGEIIFLLDSDDSFFPHKVETMVNYFLQIMPQTPDALIFHRFEIRTNDENSPSFYRPRTLRGLDGKKKNNTFEKLSDPESAYQYVQKWGFLRLANYPTSSISLTRSLADKIFPLPEQRISSQDGPLFYASRLLGTVYGTSEVLGSYFFHGKNVSISLDWSVRINRYSILDNFLNNILEKMNKKRAVSFIESRYAQTYFRDSGSIKGLLKLAYNVPARYLCLETMLFSIKTLWPCLNLVLGIKKKPRLTKKMEIIRKS